MANEIVKWEFHLANSLDMSRIGVISQARDRQLTLIHNAPGSATFNVPVTDPLFAGIEPVKHCIIAYRNAVPIWSGLIWNMKDDLPGMSGRTAVSCVGWFEILNHRVLRANVTYPRLVDPPITITGGGIVFADPFGVVGAADYHPGGLLTIANAQHDTWIVEGTNTDTMLRAISYQFGQSIGQAIIGLTEVEAGFDFYIDPLTRVMNIKNWDEYEDVSATAQFGYNWGPNNLQDVGRELDASTMCNRDTAMGTFGGGMAEDTAAQSEYQLFEEVVNLSDVVDTNVLLAFAGGEVTLRARPRVIYTLQPFPWKRGQVPQPFVDYGLGKVVEFSAKKGTRINIQRQKVRVFGMNVSITNEGNEKLGQLQVTP